MTIWLARHGKLPMVSYGKKSMLSSPVCPVCQKKWQIFYMPLEIALKFGNNGKLTYKAPYHQPFGNNKKVNNRWIGMERADLKSF